MLGPGPESPRPGGSAPWTPPCQELGAALGHSAPWTPALLPGATRRCAGPGVGTSVLGQRRARSSVSSRARVAPRWSQHAPRLWKAPLVAASTKKRSAGPAGQRGGVAGESTPARALARGAPAEARFVRAATRAAGRRATGTVTAAASATPSSGAPARWLTARGRRASGVAAAPRVGGG